MPENSTLVIHNDALLRELGRATVEFSTVEHLLSFCITLLLFGGDGEDQAKGERVTGKLPFAEKIDLLSRLFLYMFGEDRARQVGLKELCAKLDLVRMERNEMQHSVWLAANLEMFLTVNIKLSRKGATRKVTHLTQKHLREQVATIHEARRATLAFLETLIGCGLSDSSDGSETA